MSLTGRTEPVVVGLSAASFSHSALDREWLLTLVYETSWHPQLSNEVRIGRICPKCKS
jgi:hypothetical protein